MAQAVPNLLVLTEDTGEHADEVPRRFLVKLLNRIEKGVVRLDDEQAWDLPTEFDRRITGASEWKNSSHRDLVNFRQRLATKLCQEHGFVIWHIDADVAYNRWGESENIRKFEELYRSPVREILLGRGEKTAQEADRWLSKLLLLMPSYSIEAWCFQHTELAENYCKCRKDCQAKLTSWAADRGQLDEIEQPKQELCFGSKYNAELAGRGYPLQSVLAAEKSLHDALEMLRECRPLVAALEQARPAWE